MTITFHFVLFFVVDDSINFKHLFFSDSLSQVRNLWEVFQATDYLDYPCGETQGQERKTIQMPRMRQSILFKLLRKIAYEST